MKKIQGGKRKSDTSSITSVQSGMAKFLEKVKSGEIDLAETLVIDDPVLAQGFTQVPNAILRDPKLSCADKILYCLLLMFAWKQARCFPGQQTLADLMPCTVRTVITCMSHLKAHRLIEIERRGQGKVNVYHICRLTSAYPQMVDRGARG